MRGWAVGRASKGACEDGVDVGAVGVRRESETFDLIAQPLLAVLALRTVVVP